MVCDVIKGRAHNEGLLKLYSGVFAELAPNLGERLFQVSHFVAVCTNRYIGDIRGLDCSSVTSHAILTKKNLDPADTHYLFF